MRTLLSLAAVAPALAANSWSVIANNVATEATGIAFVADGKTGYLAGGANGVGAQILKTTDGGNTWSPTGTQFEMLFLDVTAYGSTIMAAGALSDQYSLDAGSTWNYSTNGAAAAQCARNVGPHDTPVGVGLAGQFGLFNPENGVGVSLDGGATFGDFNDPGLVVGARYAAFPSATTWYVSAGQWPGEGSDDQTSSSGSGSGSTTSSGSGGSTSSSAGAALGVRHITERVSVLHDDAGNAKYVFKQPSGRRVSRRASPDVHAYQGIGSNPTPPPNNTYAAQISMTTDGGSTWTSVYYSENLFYFNGIDCIDENNCCVGAENDDSGPTGGAFIYCTWDGGATWNQTYYSNQTGASILDLRTVGTNGYWAVGGVINGFPEAAGFLYSSDAGQTWTVDSVIPDYYVTSVDCTVGTQECWATVLDAEQSSDVAYSAGVSAGRQ